MARWLAVLLAVTLVSGSLYLVKAGDAPQKGKSDIDAIFKKLDTDKDGMLSKDEFLKLANRFKDKEKARDKLTHVYGKIDTSKSGVTKAQFRQYLEAVRKKAEH